MLVKPYNMFTGCDPELFIKREGAIVGSEKLIPEDGLNTVNSWRPPYVVRDGVQVELNPPAAQDLQYLGQNISVGFKLLGAQIARRPEFSLDFSGTIEVSREELDSLSPKSRILGCAPSKNIWGSKPITVNAAEYRKRSAGGHIHLGLGGEAFARVFENRDDLVPLLDFFVGNTLVMLDRDPGVAERRENYGRAGEYRTPKHGLEYRTPSNFWLRGYPLMSLAMGLAEIPVAILKHKFDGKGDLENELVELLDVKSFIAAIDGNDWNLARANFEILRPFIVRHIPTDGSFMISAANIDKFIEFAGVVNKKGLEAFFPEDPLTHWTSEKRVGFVQFLEGV